METRERRLAENLRVFSEHNPEYEMPATPVPVYGWDEAAGREIAKARYDATKDKHAAIFHFIGISDGATPKYFFDSHTNRCVFFVYEKSVEDLIPAFSAHDYTSMIESGRVFFFIGADAGDRLDAFLAQNPNIHLDQPQQILTCTESAGREEFPLTENHVAEIIGKIRTRNIEWNAQFARTYRAPKMTEIAAKYESGAPLRLLFIKGGETSYIQYAVRDLAEAAAELGHQVLTITDGRGRYFTRSFISRTLDGFRPDLVIDIGGNMTPYFMELLDLFDQPHILWFFDNPQFFVTGESLAAMEKPHRSIVALVPRFARELRQIGVKRRIPLLSVGVNEHIFNPSAPEAARAPSHDTLFVGNIYNHLLTKPDLIDDKLKEILVGIKKVIEPAIDGIYSAEQAARYFISRISTDPAADEAIMPIIDGLASQAFREVHRYTFIRAAAEGRELHVYGNGWDDYPDTGIHHGPVTNGPELAALYSSAKITLQVHELTQIHPRVLECLASGGFILAREIPPDEDEPPDAERFAPDAEIAYFRTRDEMCRLMDYYLGDPKAREEIARAGRDRVLRDFTWKCRVRSLLDAALLDK